jgi:hypothetical protein
VGETERFPVREMAGVPVKDRLGLKVHWNLTACTGKVAVEVTVLPENIQPVVLEKLMDPLPSPTCMVGRVVVLDIIWAQVQEEVQFHWKHMVMVT